jgi:hypothetical protein
MGSVDNSCNAIICTDDRSILISNNCCEELNRKFNEALYNTLRWFQANQLILNMRKTKVIKHTSANFSYSPLPMTLAEHLPVETIVIKFLGPELDSQLMENPHINYLFP